MPAPPERGELFYICRCLRGFSSFLYDSSTGSSFRPNNFSARGGSNVAAAICNAMLYQASNNARE